MGNIPVKFITTDGSMNMVCSQKDASIICSGPTEDAASSVRAHCSALDDVNYNCSTVTDEYACARVDGINGQINVNCKKREKGVNYQQTPGQTTGTSGQAPGYGNLVMPGNRQNPGVTPSTNARLSSNNPPRTQRRNARGMVVGTATPTPPVFSSELEVTSSSVYLQWSQPTLPPVSGGAITTVTYQINQVSGTTSTAVGSAIPITIPADATSVPNTVAQIPSLTAGTVYTYYVTAIYTVTPSSVTPPTPDQSANISVMPIAPPTLTNDNRTISWTIPSALTGITGFDLYRDPSANPPVAETDIPINGATQISATATSYNDSTASSGSHVYQLATYFNVPPGTGNTPNVVLSAQTSFTIKSNTWIWVVGAIVILFVFIFLGLLIYFMRGKSDEGSEE